MMWKKTMLVMAMGALAACNGETTADSGAVDSGGNDVVSMNDTGTSHDAAQDTGSTTDANANDTGTTADAGAFGMCGASVHSCLCGCAGADGGTSGQQACTQACIEADNGCTQCVINGQASCCPTEAQALVMCEQNAMVASDAGPACAASDQACLQSRCGTEINAFQTCVGTQLMTSASCRASLAQCTGSYPITCP